MMKQALIFLLLGLGLQAAYGQSNANFQGQGVLNWQVSEDAWVIHRNVGPDASPFIRPATYLYLPDSDTQWTYRNPVNTLQTSGVKRLSSDWQVDIKFRADQVVGPKFDQLSLSHDISPAWGFRAGVVDYRTTWCPTYDTDNPWVYSPTLTCSTRTFSETAGGAPGVQSFVNLELNDRYRFQGLVGLYNPLWLNYAPKEFAQFIPSLQYQVKENHKWGFSLNLLDDYEGAEYRLSWIRAKQLSFSPEPEYLYYYHQKTDLLYAAAQFALENEMTLQLSQTWFKLNNNCEETTVDSCNPAISDHAGTTTLGLNYRFSGRDTLGVSISRYQLTAAMQMVSDQFFTQSHQSFAAAWRRDWSRGWFTAVQVQKTSQSLAYFYTDDFPSQGVAIGVRIAYRFDN